MTKTRYSPIWKVTRYLDQRMSDYPTSLNMNAWWEEGYLRRSISLFRFYSKASPPPTTCDVAYACVAARTLPEIELCLFFPFLFFRSIFSALHASVERLSRMSAHWTALFDPFSVIMSAFRKKINIFWYLTDDICTSAWRFLVTFSSSNAVMMG